MFTQEDKDNFQVVRSDISKQIAKMLTTKIENIKCLINIEPNKKTWEKMINNTKKIGTLTFNTNFKRNYKLDMLTLNGIPLVLDNSAKTNMIYIKSEDLGFLCNKSSKL